MKLWKDWAVTDSKGRYMKSFDSYDACVGFLRKTSVGSKIKTRPMFAKPYETKVSKYCKVQRRTISQGGVSVDKTYTINVEKLHKGGKIHEKTENKAY